MDFGIAGAAAIGIVSGLAATGVHQIGKQMGDKNGKKQILK